MTSRTQTEKLVKKIMRVAELLAKAQNPTTGNKASDKQTNQSS